MTLLDEPVQSETTIHTDEAHGRKWLKIDPAIMKESMIDGLNGIRFPSRKLEFALDLSGYKDLVDNVYDTLCRKDNRLGKKF